MEQRDKLLNVKERVGGGGRRRKEEEEGGGGRRRRRRRKEEEGAGYTYKIRVDMFTLLNC